MRVIDADKMETLLREEKVVGEKTMSILAAAVEQIFEM